MLVWAESVQKMIDWMEKQLQKGETPMLLEMSRQIGYSPAYCSTQFHQVTGMTLRSYLAGRRLYWATLDVRDTDARLLDVAVSWGYSSQEALTRAFRKAYGCTPLEYRKSPRAVVLPVRQNVLFPEYVPPENRKEGQSMSKMTFPVVEPQVRVEYIPAHQYLGIFDKEVQEYEGFWNRHNCDEILGIIESLSSVQHPVVTCHTAGWFKENGKRGYFYGLGVPEDYWGEIPKGFELRKVPASYYLVFYHPPFDFLQDCGEVMERVESLAWKDFPVIKGEKECWQHPFMEKGRFEWNEDQCPDYQRHSPEVLGYQVLRPVRFVSSK